MKTAEEILSENPHLFIETDRHVDDAIAVMKLYAREVAKRALKDAAHECFDREDRRGEHYNYILETEIITP